MDAAYLVSPDGKLPWELNEANEAITEPKVEGGCHENQLSFDWLKEHITGKSHDRHGKIWLVSGSDFPLSQAIVTG